MKHPPTYVGGSPDAARQTETTAFYESGLNSYENGKIKPDTCATLQASRAEFSRNKQKDEIS
ncbi:MAG: hypothetical protein ACRCUY_11425 [Thermoguttaceae bacterium]